MKTAKELLKEIQDKKDKIKASAERWMEAYQKKQLIEEVKRPGKIKKTCEKLIKEIQDAILELAPKSNEGAYVENNYLSVSKHSYKQAYESFCDDCRFYNDRNQHIWKAPKNKNCKIILIHIKIQKHWVNSSGWVVDIPELEYFNTPHFVDVLNDLGFEPCVSYWKYSAPSCSDYVMYLPLE